MQRAGAKLTATKPYSPRLVHIGDACRATSPQLGQGANMALLDALALAQALERCPEDLASALERYARMRRWHVRVFQWASVLFTSFYQPDSRVFAVCHGLAGGAVVEDAGGGEGAGAVGVGDDGTSIQPR